MRPGGAVYSGLLRGRSLDLRVLATALKLFAKPPGTRGSIAAVLRLRRTRRASSA
jgi:hypothetical protein